MNSILKNPLFCNLFFFVAIFFVFLCPGSEKMIFSGMPLNLHLEYFVFLVFLVLFWAKLINQEIIVSFNHTICYFILICLLLISWKWYSFISDAPEGFKAKYRAISSGTQSSITPPGKHEFSADYFFHSRDFTRYDRTLNFDSDWNLGFWNQNRFNIYDWIKGNQIRQRSQFEVTWTGDLSIPIQQHAFLQIEYTGKTRLNIGTYTFEFPEEYLSKRCERIPLTSLIALPSSECYPFLLNPPPAATFSAPLEINYEFALPSFVGSSSIGPNSFFSFTYNDGLYQPKPIQAGKLPSSLFLTLMKFIIDFFLLVVTVIIILNETEFLRKDYLFWFLIVLWGIFFKYFPENFAAIAVISIFIKILCQNIWGANNEDLKNYRLKIINFLLFVSLVIPNINIDLSSPVYRSPGSDALTYESIAREMLEDTAHFFSGSEPVFFFQPLFRYYLAVMHILFGEGSNGFLLFGKCLYFCLITLMIRAFSNRMGFVLSALFSFMFAFFEHFFIFPNIQAGWSENLGWFFFLLPILLGLAYESPAVFFLVPICLGVSTITRLNFGPGCLHLLICLYFYLSQKNPGLKQKILFPVFYFGFFFAVYSLIPLHNYYFGNRIVLSVLQVNLSQILNLAPQRLLYIFSDPSVKTYLIDRLELYFHFFNLRFLNILIAFFAGCVFLQIVLVLLKRSKSELLKLFFLLSPLSFMIVHLFLALADGYPRFTISYLILMFVFPVFFFGNDLERGFKYLCEKARSLTQIA